MRSQDTVPQRVGIAAVLQVSEILMDRRGKTMSERMDLVYTIQGEPVVRCFLAPTTEGFLFGLSHPRVGDIHLTAFFKDGKIRTHIKDSARNPAYVHDRTFTPDILGRRIEGRMRRFMKPYHPNMVAWIMRPALKRRLIAALDFPTQNGAISIPLEVVRGYVLVNLRNKRRWRRVRIRDLLEMPDELAVRIEGGRLYIVRPFDDRNMFKFTEGQAQALNRLLLDYLGFGEYGNYVSAKLAEAPRSVPPPARHEG